jgi:hypothetical protein
VTIQCPHHAYPGNIAGPPLSATSNSALIAAQHAPKQKQRNGEPSRETLAAFALMSGRVAALLCSSDLKAEGRGQPNPCVLAATAS